MKTLATTEAPTLATQLQLVETEMDILDEKRIELRKRLLDILKSQHVKSIKTEEGVVFTRSHRESLKVKSGMEEMARVWADDNFCVKIDLARATAILRRQLKLPKFFMIEKGAEYLTISKVK